MSNEQETVVGIPATIVDVQNGGIEKFSLDLKKPTDANITVDTGSSNTAWLEFRFSIAGIKVPPDGRPPGATHFCFLPYSEINQNLLLADGVESKIMLDPDQEVGTLSFKLNLGNIEIAKITS